MPLVQISIFKGRDASTKSQISYEIHHALVESIKIPDSDFNHRIYEFDRDNWQLPPEKSEQFTLVEIALFPGRSAEAKGTLYANIVTRLGALGIPADDIFILVNEQPLQNWGIRGGTRADLVNFNFKLNV